MNYYPAIESASASAIKAFQEDKLRSLVSYLNERSPFYKKLFYERGMDTASIKSLEDLVRIPVTTKDDLQKHNWDFLCVPKQDIAEYTSTSGTLGKPVTVALTKNDLDRLAYNEAISFANAGCTSDDIFQMMLTLDRQFMAGIAYYSGIQKMGAGVVRVGPGLPAMQLESIERFKPTVLIAVPSFLVKLVEYAEQRGILMGDTSVKRIVCIGESVRTPDFQLNALGKRITKHWNVSLVSTYASTEMQTAFTECEEGKGGHLHPELLIVELLDEKNQPVPEGEVGEVTITTLGVEGMPLLRYKTGDISIAHRNTCSCGRHTLRLGPVMGRKQQMIKLKGTTLYPPGIFEIIQNVNGITDFVVEAYTSPLGVDELRLILLDSADQYSVEKQLVQEFQSRLRVKPEILFRSQAEFEQLMATHTGRKIQRFLDRRIS